MAQRIRIIAYKTMATVPRRLGDNFQRPSDFRIPDQTSRLVVSRSGPPKAWPGQEPRQSNLPPPVIMRFSWWRWGRVELPVQSCSSCNLYERSQLLSVISRARADENLWKLAFNCLSQSPKASDFIRKFRTLSILTAALRLIGRPSCAHRRKNRWTSQRYLGCESKTVLVGT